MNTTPFDHGFKHGSFNTYVGYEMLGYNRAMIEVLNYLHKTTDFKPENRYIDAVPLLEQISATLGEITAIYEASRLQDISAVNILSGTKPDEQ